MPDNSDLAMRYGITTKLALLLTLFAVLAAGITGYYSHAESRRQLVDAAQQELVSATQVLGRRMSLALLEVARNTRLLATLPVVHALARNPDDEKIQTELADTFASMLVLNPEYFQIRLITAANFGKELVRIDRDRFAPLRVSGEDLQEKGHYPYVFETLKLRDGEIYLSDIVLNHERGAHQGLEQPTLRVATPVLDANGQRFGIIVINVDLNGLFNLLKTDLPSGVSVYLTNEKGDYLIHPDKGLSFGFDKGRRLQLQVQFPHAMPLFNHGPEHLVTTMPIPETGERSVVALLRLPFGEIDRQRFVVLGLGKPLNDILRASNQLGENVLSIVLGFSLLAVLVAILTSRLATRSINQMVDAVRRFASEHTMGALPVNRQDEIGLLARTMHDMQEEMSQQLNALYENRTHLDHLARHDTLTGLPNRLMFFDRLEQAIVAALRDDRLLAVLFVDLDRFKQINDSLGHNIGDDVLRAAATIFRSLVRKSDIVGRLGGDEFVILFSDIDDVQQVHVIAEKIIHKFQQPISIDGHDLYVHASIGIALYPHDGITASELVRHADVAMYQAKHNGRNTLQFYTADLSARAIERMTMENEMRQALEREEFVLHYQPQISLATGELIGVEALVRWQHPRRGLVEPGKFIPLAEETGLIVALGEFILRTACTQMYRWQQHQPRNFRVAVNMADRQLRSKDLLSTVEHALQESGCRPEWLELEVTEGFFMTQRDDSIVQLEKLRKEGVELSIDDFGTGYSSLAYLKTLPIHKLKIDRSFVRDIPQDSNDMAIARAVIALARSLDLRVIAEGVETEQQLDFFRQEGCDQVQGFLFSPALNADAMTHWLEGQNA